MTRNIGSRDRLLRVTAALPLLACAFLAPLPLPARLAAGAAPAVYLLLTALLGACLGYRLMGRSTCRRGGAEPMGGRPHDEVLRAAIAGDDEALSLLVKRYHDRVYRFGLRICRDRFDADDAVQEAFAKLATRPDVQRHEGALSWLMTVVRNACQRLLRPFARGRTRLGSVEGALEEVPATDAPADALLERFELVKRVHEILSTLPRPYREVLVLRDVEGLTGEETAAKLGLPEPTMKTRLLRAGRWCGRRWSTTGLSVTLVGYGMDRNPTGPADLGGRGIQRHTPTTVIAGSFGSNADIFYFDDASHSTRPHDSGGPSYIWRNGRRIVGIHGGFFPTNPGWAGYDTKAGIASYAQWVYTIARQIDPLPVVTMDYTWTAADGTDLDTRTAVVEPARFAPVGWAKAQTDGPAARPYLTWTSGDNQGTGSERVVADVASLAMDYPPTVASHVFYFGQAAFWYGSRAAGNVGLSVVTGPQQRTRTVNVTLQTTSGASNGQPIGTVTLDTWSRRLHIF